MITTKVPSHLGGSLYKTHVDYGVLDYLSKKYDIKTMVDVGCGPGGMVDYANSKGISAFGIDGDESLIQYFKNIDKLKIHDFTLGKVKNISKIDLAWSVEFVEHVEFKYLENFMDIFMKSKYVVMTHALPNAPGIHHVNCQSEQWWIDKMKEFGLNFDLEETNNIRKVSTMHKYFMRTTGKFFKNENTSKE